MNTGKTFPEWAPVCIKLLQGVIYRTSITDATWNLLEMWQSEIQKYFETIGVTVFIEKNDGYAFLKQIDESEYADSAVKLPKLIQTRPMTVELSLICVVLREALDQFDVSEDSSSMLVLTQADIRDRLSTFLPDSSDQTKVYRKLDEYMNRIEELGFVKRIEKENFTHENADEKEYEIRRIIRAKIDLDFMTEFKKKLEEQNGE